MGGFDDGLAWKLRWVAERIKLRKKEIDDLLNENPVRVDRVTYVTERLRQLQQDQEVVTTGQKPGAKKNERQDAWDVTKRNLEDAIALEEAFIHTLTGKSDAITTESEVLRGLKALLNGLGPRP
jgi:hypothetical protein